MEKLKSSSTDFVKLDSDVISRARNKFHNSLFGKLFGKPPQFDQVKASLLAKWGDFGELIISDIPNGLLLIHCPSHNVLEKLLTDGPWSLNGLTL